MAWYNAINWYSKISQDKNPKITATQNGFLLQSLVLSCAEKHNLYASHTEAATVLRPIFRPNRMRSQLCVSAVPVWSHKSPYGRCSNFSRSAEFWNVQNFSLRLIDRSAVGLLSVCACTARTVVTVKSPSAALHSHAVVTARNL